MRPDELERRLQVRLDAPAPSVLELADPVPVGVSNPDISTIGSMVPVADRVEVFEHVPRFYGDRGPGSKIGELDVDSYPRLGDEIEIAGAVWVVVSTQPGQMTVKPKESQA
jgi:hypothetical protein